MKSELHSTYAKQYESYEMVELVKEKFGGQWRLEKAAIGKFIPTSRIKRHFVT